MTVTYNLCALLVFTISVCSRFVPALCSAHCGHSLQVLDNQVGEIRSSAYHSWSYRFGPTYDCWIIKGVEGEPVVLSFSQFSARCRKEWVSIKSSTGGEPVVLCGSKLPPPMEFPGGNITVMHHFLPHLFPVSSFLLSYARDSGECPVTSFECLGGRCLPLSWRCNGQVECLGEGPGIGTDEQDCDAEVETPQPPKRRSTQAEETQRETYTEINHDRDSDRHKPVDKTWSSDRSWPCGGLLQTFYGTFSPPAIRNSALYCVWTLDPQDSRPLRLDLQQLVLGHGDRLTIYNREQGNGDVIKTITSTSNYKSVQVESHTGLLSMVYETLPGSEGSGFNATFHVGSYCPPWEGRCGGASGGCFTQEQRCDGKWDCPETGKDEEGCRGCSPNQFACGMTGQRALPPSHFSGRPVCYPVTERCNYQLYCADGRRRADCTVCQPGTFHCDSDRCVFESCLVCGLLLVIAMGCTCKLYSLRTREYSMFAPISRQEAELIQQQAPPSYGQLIARASSPARWRLPTENPNEVRERSVTRTRICLQDEYDFLSSASQRHEGRGLTQAPPVLVALWIVCSLTVAKLVSSCLFSLIKVFRKLSFTDRSL
uniref:Low density lipoprotein receptor-related protein 10 n=1 Tax=Lates calcarifer TaxID=8187 RepID=A0A4W6G670_LATCA